jgi:hypothetical protein
MPARTNTVADIVVHDVRVREMQPRAVTQQQTHVNADVPVLRAQSFARNSHSTNAGTGPSRRRQSIVGRRGPEAELCFVEIGPVGSSITPADRTNLAALVAQANAATHQTQAIQKKQPTPRLYVYGSYADEPLR